LPMARTHWGGDVLAAVVAHEASHVRRHDSWVHFAAPRNCALVWFHPLAWWLEKKLALTAEHACDDAAASAVGGPARYAEILVDMADVCRRQRGRVFWQAVGVTGGGPLESRVDRLLRGERIAIASRVQK